MADLAFVIRPAADDDLNFIRSTWLREYADSSWARAAGASYWPGHIRIRDELLDRAPPIVASLEVEPTSICGWACFEAGTIHFVFVRPRWQKLGVARLLLEPFDAKPAVYTHKTRGVDSNRLPKEWMFDPYQAIQHRRSA